MYTVFYKCRSYRHPVEWVTNSSGIEEIKVNMRTNFFRDASGRISLFSEKKAKELVSMLKEHNYATDPKYKPLPKL